MGSHAGVSRAEGYANLCASGPLLKEEPGLGQVALRLASDRINPAGKHMERFLPPCAAVPLCSTSETNTFQHVHIGGARCAHSFYFLALIAAASETDLEHGRRSSGALEVFAGGCSGSTSPAMLGQLHTLG